jgi:hypothetical protein
MADITLFWDWEVEVGQASGVDTEFVVFAYF